MSAQSRKKQLGTLIFLIGPVVWIIVGSMTFGIEPENLLLWDYGKQYHLVGDEFEQAKKENPPVDFEMDMRWGLTETSQSILFSLKNHATEVMVVDSFHNHILGLWGDGVSESAFTRPAERVKAGYIVYPGAEKLWRWKPDEILFTLMSVHEHERSKYAGKLARLHWSWLGQGRKFLWVAFPNEDNGIEGLDVFKNQTNDYAIVGIIHNATLTKELLLVYFEHESDLLPSDVSQYLSQSTITIKLVDKAKELSIIMDHLNSSMSAHEVSNGVCYIMRVSLDAIHEGVISRLFDYTVSKTIRYDVVWMVNEVVSEPLHMALLPPTRKDKEYAFAKQHAHVKSICAKADVKYDVRISGVNAGNLELKAILKNREANPLRTELSFVNSNFIRAAFRGGVLFSLSEVSDHPRSFLVESGASVAFFAPLDSHIRTIESYSTRRLSLSTRIGVIINYRWRTPVGDIGSVWVAYPDQYGEVSEIHYFVSERDLKSDIGVVQPIKGATSRVIGDEDDSILPILALSYKEDSPVEIWCMVYDKDENTLVLHDEVFSDSVVEIFFNNEIVHQFSLSDWEPTQAKNDFMISCVWRIPWQMVHDLIPEADLATIKAASGELDLVWKVGEFKSDPLPISLGESGGAQ